METLKVYETEELKAKRVEIDALFQFIKNEQKNAKIDVNTLPDFDMELYGMANYQVMIHLKNAKMWIGVMLEGRGNPFPKELADKSMQ